MDALFDPEPEQWGLRGDPYLWREMKATVCGRPCPASDDELEVVIRDLFLRLTGVPLGEQEFVGVLRYAHGGMSSGQVSSEFWSTKALPLLKARLGD